MDGLKHILSKIENDAYSRAEEITSSAKKEAEAILADSQASAQKKADEIIKNAKRKSDMLIANAESSAELFVKKSILSAKSDIVSSGISNALEKICSLGSDEYFGIIYALISKYAHSENGEIQLCQRDLQRLPQGFEEKANSLLTGGGKLTLSDKPAEISGGVILIYGMVEENCSFEAILSEKKSEINDALFAAFSA